MANAGTIATRISLEGAEEIKAKLDELTKSGEAALAKLKGAAPTGNFDALSASLDKVKASSQSLITNVSGIGAAFQAAGTATTALNNNMSNLGLSVSGLAGRFLGLGSLTLGGVIAAFAGITQSAISSATAMEKAANAAGISFEKFQVLAQAAKRSGLELEDLSKLLRKFTQEVDQQGQQQFKGFIDVAKDLVTALGAGSNIKFLNFAEFEKVKLAAQELAPKIKAVFTEANDPRANQSLQQIAATIEKAALSSEDFRKKLASIAITVPGQSTIENLDRLVDKAKGDFAALGISLIDLNGKIKSPEKALLEFIDKVSKLPTAAERAGAVIKVFGRQAGPELANLISLGTDNIDAIAKKMQELKIGFSTEDLAKAKDARKSFKELSEAVTQLKNELGISLAPFAAQIVRGMSAIVTEIRLIVDKFSGFWNEAWTNIAIVAGAALAKLPFLAVGTALLSITDPLRQLGAMFGLSAEGANLFARGLQTVSLAAPILAALAIPLAAALSRLGIGGIAIALTLATPLLQKFAESMGLSVPAVRALGVALTTAAIAGFLFAGPAGWIAAVILAVPTFLSAINDMIGGLQKFQVQARARVDFIKTLNDADKALLNASPGDLRKQEDAGPLLARQKKLFDELDRLGKEAVDSRVDNEKIAADRVAQLNKNASKDVASAWETASKAMGLSVKREVAGLDAELDKLKTGVDALGKTQGGSIKFKGVDDFATLGKPKTEDKGAAEKIVAPFEDADKRIRAILVSLKTFIDQQAAEIAKSIQNAMAVLKGGNPQAGAGQQGAQGEPTGQTPFSGLAETIVQPFRDAAAQIPIIFETILQSVTTFGQILSDGLTTAFDGMLASLQTTAQQIDAVVAQIVASAARAAQALQSAGQGGAFGGNIGSPFARGGYVVGPGSSTSDSILARLSAGEFVIRARAVEHFGAGFFQSLNSLRMPKFSLGGLFDGVSESFGSALHIPRFAEGGLVPAAAGSSLHPVTLQFPDGRKVSGLRAPARVVRELQRESAMAQVTGRAGPAPSWTTRNRSG